MPFKSKKQERYFQACKHNPGGMSGKCPPRHVIDKFIREEKRSKRKKK